MKRESTGVVLNAEKEGRERFGVSHATGELDFV